MKLALRKGTKAHANKALYEQQAGLKLGDHLSSDEYCVEAVIRPVVDQHKPKGAWVKAWIYVSIDEIMDLNEEDIVA